MIAEDKLAAAAATIGSMPAEQMGRQLERLGAAPPDCAAPPGTGVLTALQEAVMAVCWAASTLLTATAVFGRLDYPGTVTRCTVADCLLSLHRAGYLTGLVYAEPAAAATPLTSTPRPAIRGRPGASRK